jgi:hypothetical protein
VLHDASGGVPGGIRRGEGAPQEQLFVAQLLGVAAQSIDAPLR